MHRMSQAGVKVSTWASVLAEIMNDWRSPKGKELGEVLASHVVRLGDQELLLGQPILM